VFGRKGLAPTLSARDYKGQVLVVKKWEI
jgi:hypothetical protein